MYKLLDDDVRVYLSVTKKFEFCYGHFLENYEGVCQRQHGHNSTVEVEVSDANRLPKDTPVYKSMVVDFKEIKEVCGAIIKRLDHFNLNEILPEEFCPPTAENIALYLFNEINKHTRFTIERVRVYETPDSYAEVKRVYQSFEKGVK